MITIYKKESKNRSLLLKDIDTKEIHYKINEPASKLLSFKKSELIYIEKEEVVIYIKEFFKNLEKSLNTKIDVKVTYNEDVYNIVIDTIDNSVIIGKEGKTLSSIQLLLHQIINNLTNFNLKINVDCADYKEKKKKRFEIEISKICKEILDSKIKVKLDSMNSYERRLVHNIVAKFEKLNSNSCGTEPNRYVVISFKED